MIKRIIFFIIPVLALLFSCDDKSRNDVKFSYPGIIDKEYRFNVGRIIPVTIGQAIETDGDISRDGRFFFYSSNSAGGNFDIYLRSMTDITTVRLTSHPSKDTMPVISPDGKKLAFVSFREDPEGDIFIMKIDPGKLIESEEKSVTSISTLDNIAQNITSEKEAESGIVLNIKDSYPVWSPDGNMIAYSSEKGGKSNIWIMKPDGSDRKRLTEKGGEYPAFSMDGKSLVFISYKENPRGDVYTIDLGSRKETRITSSDSIKLYPSFMNDRSRIIFSSIESDTNGNGSLDLQDRSIIRFIDTKNGLSYAMTKRSDSSFKARWLPVLATRDYNGIIVYTDITDENINLNIIPETGVIPKKNNAKLQYELCDNYLIEYDDPEKYVLALEAVYNIFWKSGDDMSRAYVNRALEESAMYYKKTGDKGEFKRVVEVLRNRAAKKDLYAAFIIDIIEKGSSLKGAPDIRSLVKKFGSEKKDRYFIPFALEDIADIYISRGDSGSAYGLLKFIVENYPSFERINDIQTKISLNTDDLRKKNISEAAVIILTKGNPNQKISVIKNLIEPFSRSSISSSEAASYLSRISKMKTRFKEDKKITAALNYISGLLYERTGASGKSREEFLSSISLSHPNDLPYYLSNIKLGEIEKREGNSVEAEKYFSAGITRYSRRFKTENFKERLIWLVGYYSQTGEKYSQSGNYKDAAELYDRLINVLNLMYNKKLYPEVYVEYAPNAHVFYINSYVSWKGDSSISDLEKSYKDKLNVFRMDFNKAAIYGYGYLYAKKALILASEKGGAPLEDVYDAFKKSDEQIDWALFIDDTFIEPYILKSWIYQYIDLERETGGADAAKYAGMFFPKHLWEENTIILEKALNANDENLNPEYEGDLHLNMANNYFLLTNYPRALRSYRLAEKYKKRFGSDIEKALFHFHLGYSLWQNNDIKTANAEIKKAYDIYASLSSGGGEKYRYQMLTLYRYFALFGRFENRYDEAIEWYRKIIKYAEDNRLEIDRARYFQEIAWCYMKSGDSESARSWLGRASEALEKYSDEEIKSSYRIRLFGLLPIRISADPIIVGDNKIYYPLDTKSKKLLNLAMLEEIAASESNYTDAIKYLNDKIALLKDSDSDVAVDTKIRSLNNIGYYMYMSGKYSGTEDYFNRAGALAGEKNNLDGIKKSMMNLVNLYSMMIEGNMNIDQDWINKLSVLGKKIESYRNNYYDLRFAQEKEKIEAEAKAKGTAVTDEQISEMTKSLKSETLAIYYSLDVSAAILKFYLAELIYASDPVSKDRDASKSKYYLPNRDSFTLYVEALGYFQSAIGEAAKSGNGELKAKLLINSGICYERTGDYEKAYVALLDAKNFSEKNSLDWIKINSYHRLALFLSAHGREAGESDSIAMADRFFNLAVTSIEEYPVLYSRHQNRVGTIYKDYINFLIGRGSEKRAFECAERYSQVASVMLVNSVSPEFSNEYDREAYYGYVSETVKLDTIRNELSSQLLAGKDPLSPEVAAIRKKISSKDEQLKSLQKKIKNSNASIRNYIGITGYSERQVKHDLYRFHQTEKGLYYWKVSQGKMTAGYIKGNAGTVFPEGSSSPVFIILSDTVIDLINSGNLKPSENYIFISSFERANDYTGDSNAVKGGIYSDEKMAGAVEGVESASGSDKNPVNYPVIVDVKGSGFEVNPESLFSSYISPACIIQTGAACSYSYLVAMLEGALYAGTKRLVIIPESDIGRAVPFLKIIYGGKQTLPEKPFFTLGYINIYSDKRVTDNKQLQQNELSLFDRCMKEADFNKAALHLARWNSFQKDKRSFEYTDRLWQLELLSGRIKNSITALDSFTPAGEDQKSALKIRKAYTYIYSGDFSGAAKEMTGLSETGKYRSDINALKALVKLVSDGNLTAAEKFNGMKKPEGLTLPAERYLTVAAGYLFAVNDRRSAGIASLISDGAFLSESEHLLRCVITGVTPPKGRSIRFDRIAALGDFSDLSLQREEALKLVNGSKGADSLSAFPLVRIYISHRGRGQDEELVRFTGLTDIGRITEKADYLVSLILLGKIDEVLAGSEKYSARVPILNAIKSIAENSSLMFIKKETLLNTALNYLMMGNFNESFKIALGGEEIYVPEDSNYVDMQLLRMNLYISSGKYKEAAVKGDILSKIENLPSDRKFMLTLQLALIELHRLSTLKNVTVADAAQFEKLFAAALAFAKHDTDLLNRRGYREMASAVFDEFIVYKMKTGQHTDAHYYNEVKKLLISSSKCGVNLFKYAGSIDMAAVQGFLPEDAVYLNVARVKGDLFIWAADKKIKKAFIIEKGYSSVQKYIEPDSGQPLSGDASVKALREITRVLSPVMSLLKDKKRVLISADSDSERIPFEISGEGDGLAATAQIIYVPSLLVSSAGKISVSREVSLPDAGKSAESYLAAVALKESGIKFERGSGTGNGFIHLSSGIKYNRVKKGFSADGKNVSELIGDAAVLFAPSDKINGAGVSDFVLAARDYKLKSALLNGSQVQDANNALFIEEFYRSVSKGTSIQESFAKALGRLRESGRYSEPANWSGYRLYIYDLGMLK